MCMYGKVKRQPILEMVDGFDNFGWHKTLLLLVEVELVPRNWTYWYRL